MREANQAMAEMALNLYRECLRKVLMQRGGYECQETEGSFMLSFYSCIDAVQFCVLVTSILPVLPSLLPPPSSLLLLNCLMCHECHVIMTQAFLCLAGRSILSCITGEVCLHLFPKRKAEKLVERVSVLTRFIAGLSCAVPFRCACLCTLHHNVKTTLPLCIVYN